MNTDEKGMNTDFGIARSSIRVHPWTSLFIILKPFGVSGEKVGFQTSPGATV
jgi:hypothetical protein